MDPFVCLPDVQEHILQHFRVRDIINACTVSTSWNDLIGGTRICMEKIYLRFYEPIDDVNSLLKSSRKYQNFKMQKGCRLALLPVVKHFKWKRVMLNDDYFTDRQMQFSQFFEMLAPTLVELEMESVSPFCLIIPMDFPALEKLKVSQCNPNVLSIFTKKNPRLREFSFSGHKSNDIVDINRVMETNPQITHLTMPWNYLSRHFKLHSKLQRLKLTCFEEVMEIQLKEFTKGQRGLGELCINMPSGSDSRALPEFLRAFDNLKFLSLQGIAPSGEAIEGITTNLNLIELKIGFESTDLLLKYPNLQVFSIATVSSDIILFLCYHMKSLTLVLTARLTPEAAELYESLKSTSLPINRYIRFWVQSMNQFVYSRNDKTIEYHRD